MLKIGQNIAMTIIRHIDTGLVNNCYRSGL